MNVIIQTPEAKELFWGISRNTAFSTIVPTIIALVVFIAGIIVNRIIEHKKENKRLEELKIYFLTIIASVPNSASKLIKHYTKLANDILDEKPHNYGLPEAHQLYLENAKRISQADLFKALVTKGSKGDTKTAATHFKNLFDIFEYVQFQRERVRINFTSFMTDLSKYVDSWNNNMDLLEQRLQELLASARSHGIGPSEDPFLRELDRLFNNWTKVDDYFNIFVANTHLLDPLKHFCNKHLSDQRVTLFMPIITKLRKAHNELKDMKAFFGQSFKGEAQELKKINRAFTGAIKFFNQDNLDFKKVWNGRGRL